MDPQIKIAQAHLNSRYGSNPGWTLLVEDGISGWNTIYGLRKGLQVELGISQLATGFGPATRREFEAQLGVISENSDAPTRVLQIVNWALWCKGQTGVFDNPDDPVPVSFGAIAGAVGRVQAELGLAVTDSINVKFMSFLLSMDSHRLINSGGSARIRQVQQWFNGNYGHRRDFEVVPADGIVTRNTQTALLLGLQYELGMADGVANGNFGPGTRAGLQSVTVSPGTTDSSRHFVRILKSAMLFNELTVEWSGTYDSVAQAQVTQFQEFMELPSNATVSYGTWCALLVSSGDPDRQTQGMDTNTQLSHAQYDSLANRGYTHVGRYLTNSGAFLTADEIKSLASSGRNLIPLFQRYNNHISDMTYDNGYTQGRDALDRGRVIGLPADSIIYAAADADFVGEVVERNVMAFFEGFRDAIRVSEYGFALGAYGPRLVCRKLAERNITHSFFISASSTGFSGNIGVPMPSTWHYMQISVDRHMTLGGVRTSYDSVVVSKVAPTLPGDAILGPPPQRYGDRTPTGYDALFVWFVSAESTLQRVFDNEIAPWNSRAALLLVCNYLRLASYNDSQWELYFSPLSVPTTTFPDFLDFDLAASVLAGSAKPDSQYDVDHFAATTLGYLTWGTDIAADLGGWLMDLMSLFSEMSSTDSESAVEEYVFTAVGANAGGFGWRDVLADADAVLISKIGLDVGSGRIGVDACRQVWLKPPAERVSEFYDVKFESSVSNVEDYMSRFYGVAQQQLGGVELSPRSLISSAAGLVFWPTKKQVLAASRGFARALDRLSSSNDWDWS